MTPETQTKTKKLETITPLSQEDMANGWKLVLPKKRKNSSVQHYSVYLSQLPSHLWKNMNKLSKSGNYHTIYDQIFEYNIKPSKHDSEVYELYTLINQDYPDKQRIRTLYNYFEQQRIKGWLITKAKNILE